PPFKERVELRFEFERPPALSARVGREAVKLHCVPVINLFHTDGEPLRFDAPEQEHLVRAAGINPQHMEVYSVDSVVGIREGQAERQNYTPFVDFSHTTPARAFYRLRRSSSPINDGLDTFLAFAAPRDLPPQLSEETVSLRLTCTNRSLPGQLSVGDLSVPTATSPTLARFSNIVPVTKPLRPPLGHELHWRLLSHLSLTYGSIANTDALRALLGLYNFETERDHPSASANAVRLESIRSVSSLPVRRFLQGAPIRGQKTAIELLEKGFAPGDLFLFGCVLDELFAAHLTLNSFHELSVSSFPSKVEYTWALRSGSQPLV
ncbi:MAG TPA: type VI secretion system baseplate subunit TssF, partial [Myxococcaceae bacterium]|nr:type VI secretion system baseplate subunit TssF [Myxococcaceae bacterium]